MPRRRPTESERLRQRAALITEAERLHQAKRRTLDQMDDYLANPANQDTDPTYQHLDRKVGRIVGHLVGVIRRLGRLSGLKYEMTYDGVIRPACGTAVLTQTFAHTLANREVILERLDERVYRVRVAPDDTDPVLDRGLDAESWVGV